MGLFDRVYATCPTCGRWVEWQSKAGDCSMTDYLADSVPPEIAADIMHEEAECGCGTVLRVGPPAPPEPPAVALDIQVVSVPK